MWERFSYYGMRAFLVFYMVAKADEGGRGCPTRAPASVMALYMSSVYLLSLPGGWIADRFLGQRKAVTSAASASRSATRCSRCRSTAVLPGPRA